MNRNKLFNNFLTITDETSLKSEKAAFNRAMEMLEQIGIGIRSVGLDRYYSFSSYVVRFGDAKVYIIPRKNATIKGSWKWKETMEDFVKNTVTYLEQYYLKIILNPVSRQIKGGSVGGGTEKRR